MITAEIVADSVSPEGTRLTSFVLTYPRFIHSELMTHRVFSRNAASSRAIPLNRMIEMIEKETAYPVKWGSKQAGMQSGDEVKCIDQAREVWINAMEDAVIHARVLDGLGVHKSIANRLLEPFAHMTTLVTATEYANFFHLRAHPAAMPEFQDLAYKMLDLYKTHQPRQVNYDEWHMPFTDRVEDAALDPKTRLKIATARCARISYMTFENVIDVDKDVIMHDQLSENCHWSPFEHCATPDQFDDEFVGNFRGWIQYRKQFIRENFTQLPWETES